MSELDLKQQQALSKRSTLRVGGPADLLVEVDSQEALMNAISYAREHELRWIVIGKGSNSLFDDDGFRGLVIINKIAGITELGEGHFRVGAGHSFAHLGVWTARRGWSGLEFASGIPASVGGAVFMNAGANGRETCEAISAVHCVTTEGKLLTLHKKDLEFRYRWSSFHTLPYAIASVEFVLEPNDEARAEQLRIVAYRTATQPYGEASAGCMFRNPTGESAGALIDRLGLKSLTVGDAAVSDLHANFIINRQDARAEDVLALAQEVQRRVKKMTGIELEREVRHIAPDGGF